MRSIFSSLKRWTSPLLLLQPGDDPLQLPSLLPLHGLQDLGGALWLTVGGALAAQRLAVLQDEGVLVVPVCRLKRDAAVMRESLTESSPPLGGTRTAVAAATRNKSLRF